MPNLGMSRFCEAAGGQGTTESARFGRRSRRLPVQLAPRTTNTGVAEYPFLTRRFSILLAFMAIVRSLKHTWWVSRLSTAGALSPSTRRLPYRP